MNTTTEEIRWDPVYAKGSVFTLYYPEQRAAFWLCRICEKWKRHVERGTLLKVELMRPASEPEEGQIDFIFVYANISVRISSDEFLCPINGSSEEDDQGTEQILLNQEEHRRVKELIETKIDCGEVKSDLAALIEKAGTPKEDLEGRYEVRAVRHKRDGSKAFLVKKGSGEQWLQKHLVSDRALFKWKRVWKDTSGGERKGVPMSPKKSRPPGSPVPNSPRIPMTSSVWVKLLAAILRSAPNGLTTSELCAEIECNHPQMIKGRKSWANNIRKLLRDNPQEFSSSESPTTKRGRRTIIWRSPQKSNKDGAPPEEGGSPPAQSAQGQALDSHLDSVTHDKQSNNTGEDEPNELASKEKTKEPAVNLHPQEPESPEKATQEADTKSLSGDEVPVDLELAEQNPPEDPQTPSLTPPDQLKAGQEVTTSVTDLQLPSPPAEPDAVTPGVAELHDLPAESEAMNLIPKIVALLAENKERSAQIDEMKDAAEKELNSLCDQMATIRKMALGMYPQSSPFYPFLELCQLKERVLGDTKQPKATFNTGNQTGQQPERKRKASEPIKIVEETSGKQPTQVAQKELPTRLVEENKIPFLTKKQKLCDGDHADKENVDPQGMSAM